MPVTRLLWVWLPTALGGAGSHWEQRAQGSRDTGRQAGCTPDTQAVQRIVRSFTLAICRPHAIVSNAGRQRLSLWLGAWAVDGWNTESEATALNLDLCSWLLLLCVPAALQEITLDDMWSLDLVKLDGWNLVRENTVGEELLKKGAGDGSDSEWTEASEGDLEEGSEEEEDEEEEKAKAKDKKGSSKK